MLKPKKPLIILLGPTAVGKTLLAARLAHNLGGEVISADSRQVFRGMDIGTGKDWSDYIVKGKKIKAHLIDVADPGTEYSVFTFLREFDSAYEAIVQKNKLPIVCGGTGLYLEALIKGYDFSEVPMNQEFRNRMDKLSDSEIIGLLSQKRKLHNTTDVLDRSRMIRALEIETYGKSGPAVKKFDFSDSLVFGLRFDRKIIRERISLRLKSRLENGMIEEVKGLLEKGVDPMMLKNYGLEYNYITRFIQGELDFEQMSGLLRTAIHQFAKRQMTWFRRMEKNGIRIEWLEGEDGQDKNLIYMLSAISSRASLKD
ncbi:MAG: tRNA (adenosine(37)-N6)-dimethylallyltransferase MiaA [Bacteroidales bacterium]|nr:tRNA (adenosine(37)-N6)-dimethylallyltransferase MiaA [Bacteroidales bacterium]